MHTNSFFMVNIASGMDCGCVRPMKKDDVAQHGSHILANYEVQQGKKSWFTAYILDIGHSRYSQLTPVKTRYLLINIT